MLNTSRRIVVVPIALACLVGTAAILLAAAPSESVPGIPTRRIQFNRDLRTLLSENCLACHGPDPGTRKAGLRLDVEEGLFSDRKGGKAVIKGDPKASILYQRITTTDEEDVMPPTKTHKVLSAAQKETVRLWIEQGAHYEKHWSFNAPVRPAIPAVKNAAWVKNPIDAFILSRLEAASLAPAAQADRRTLARRLSLDLIGLPPSIESVEAFVNDASPSAYETYIDKLLASPQYGEHRGRYWLDAARYADTHGLHFDNYREMYPYREWVIKAFNANMPFDQFTMEQMAGDLLPNPTTDQKIASGFNRCNITTNEGGTIPEENLVMYTRDRTETAGRVFMGLTVGCAVCHDHKFDPISQKDFYSLSAFFNNSQMGALDGNIKNTPPVMLIPAEMDRPRWEKLSVEQASAKQAVEDRKKAAKPEYEKWLATATPDAFKKGAPLADLRLHAALDEGKGSASNITVDGKSRELPLAQTVTWAAGQSAPKAVVGAAGEIASIPDAGDFDTRQPFTCAVWAKLPAKGTTGAIVSRMNDKGAKGAAFRGWDLWVQGDRIGSHIIHDYPADALKVVADKPVDASKWHHVCITYDGTAKASGLKIYVDGDVQKSKPENESLKGTIRTDVPLKLGQRNASSAIKGLALNDLRLYGRALSPGEVKTMASGTRLAAIVAKPADKRNAKEQTELFDWYMSTQDAPSRDLVTTMAKLDAEAAAIKSRGAETLVNAEKPEPAKAFVLFRGEYDKRRDQVEPATPSALLPFPKDAPKNRLGLAQWLISPEHPLTARVTVNRLWQEMFGTGIVKTTEDLGVMGEAPSDPELLDWLAVEFREKKWDVKGIIKLIVMSSTYQQAAITTPEKAEKDGANRLLSRGPRFRMDGEMIRDTALAASGLLIEKIGGPSVRPYQPTGIWEAVAMPGSDTRSYKQDTGEGLYRRSLYTFWKRAAPPASMEIFNAPSRETCTVRRERTNTPLQALVTMNDVQFVEAGRVLAEKAMQAAPTFDGRLDFATGRLLSRKFNDTERDVMKSAYEDLLATYKASPEEARQLASVGEFKRDEKLNTAEHAAWTMLVNQLMNLDETLNK